MPLNLPTTGGDFKPFLKYNAKAGRFYIRINEQDQEVVNPTLVFDMVNIKTGWINFPLSGPPVTAWDVVGELAPDGTGWKQGFKVAVCGADPIGEREWMSNSINVNAGIMKMYEAWEAAPEHTDPTKAPWYSCQPPIAVHGTYGTNYEPVFVLGGFTERAGRFTATPPVHSSVATTAPAPNGAVPVAAPPPATNQQQPAPPPPNAAPANPFGGVSGLDDEIPF